MNGNLAAAFGKPSTRSAITDEDRILADLPRQDFIEHQKRILMAMRRECSCGSQRRQTTQQTGTEKSADWLDAADEERFKHAALLMIQRDNVQCADILTALKKIEDGTYLQCLHEIEDVKPLGCEGEIGLFRLIKRPTATLCVDCQTEKERNEKLP